MLALILIIAAAMIIGLGALAMLLWQVSGRQLDDMEGAAARILLPDTDDSRDQN